MVSLGKKPKQIVGCHCPDGRWGTRAFTIFSPFTISSLQQVNLPPSSSARKSPHSRKCFFGNTKSIPVQSRLSKVLVQAIRILLIEGALLRFKVSNIFFIRSPSLMDHIHWFQKVMNAKGCAAMICGDGIQNHWTFVNKAPPDFLITFNI